MPQDLEAIRKADAMEESMPALTKSPEEEVSMQSMTAQDEETMISELAARNSKRDEIHPYVQTLKLSDVESCVRLEAETFPPNERCSREKFQYRLNKCGELCLGIFTSHEDGKGEIATAEAANPVYSGAPERKSVLLGHIVATKTSNSTVKDEDMNIPSSDKPDPTLGHKEEGRTLCIHSLAVLPQYQGRGLGKTLLKAYLQRMETAGVGDRVALLAHDDLVPYYEGFGFENKGESEATFGGGGWFDMVRELKGEGESGGEEGILE